MMPDSLDIRSPTDGMQRTPLPLTSPSLPSVRPCSSPFMLQLRLACELTGVTCHTWQHASSMCMLVVSTLLHSLAAGSWLVHV